MILGWANIVDSEQAAYLRERIPSVMNPEHIRAVLGKYIEVIDIAKEKVRAEAGRFPEKFTVSRLSCLNTKKAEFQTYIDSLAGL